MQGLIARLGTGLANEATVLGKKCNQSHGPKKGPFSPERTGMGLSGTKRFYKHDITI